MIPDNVIADIRNKALIVDIIGEHVALKKVGHSYRGLCPFHNEKTPSFYVHSRRGFYHCFGCKASGDVFSFLTQLEGKNFLEVVDELATRTGVELPKDEERVQSTASQRARADQDRMHEVLEKATQFYERSLVSHAHGQLAQKALEARALSAQTIAAFRLGYAPSEWDALAKHLTDEGCSLRDAERLGLIIARSQGAGHYDRFRHRAMFPIRDLSGRVIAFSGRALEVVAALEEGREPPPKYINSPEHPLFHKGEVLFGLYEARVPVRRKNAAVLCEGNFDVVSLHQAGCDHAIAPLGTAFTEAHVKKIKRFAESVTLLFDADNAGKKAMRDAIPLLRNAGIQVLVATLPEGQDPDSFVRQHSSDALHKLLERAMPAIAYIIDQEAHQAGADPVRKAQAISNLGRVINEVDSPVEKQLYVERIAARFSITDLQTVRRQLQQNAPRNAGPTTKPDRPHAESIPRDIPRRELELVGIFIDQPELVRADETQGLAELLTNEDLRVMLSVILEMVETSGNLDAAPLIERFSGTPLQGWLVERLALQKYELQGARDLLLEGIDLLRQERIQQQIPNLQKQIVDARNQGDDDLALDLTKKFVLLTRSAHKIKQKSAES